MLNRIKRKIARLLNKRRNKVLARGKTKYFCIGCNKTGTTSIKKAFEDLASFPVGDQGAAQRITNKYYFEGNFAPIISYCESAQVFQDVPFSLPETFKHVDLAYPGSKFILTVRDDAEQWYQSVTRFHAKIFGNGQVPSAADLLNNDMFIKGFWYKLMKLYGAPDDDIYNKDILIAHYNRYNQEVLDYFAGRPNDLLVINLTDTDSYRRFTEFLQVDSPFENFPWENKT